MIIDEKDYLMHYGTPRKSGRYPWGSGGDPDQQTSARNQDWLGFVEDMKRQGLTDKEIYDGQGMSSTEFRARKSVARNERRNSRQSQAVRMREEAHSNIAIGKALGISEGAVRDLLKDYENRKEDILIATSDSLRDQVKKHNTSDTLVPIDIGSGTENYMGIAATKLNTAVQILKDEGYTVHDVNAPQVATGQYTKYKVLCPPGTTRTQAFNARDNIRLVDQASENFGETYDGIQPPIGISLNRVGIRYKDQGGGEMDGVIHVRPGVKDVSLGNSQYAQVRVTVGDSHYLKGMATYKDDLPEGVDLVFNTDKTNTGNKLDAMKPIESTDPLNPYGATIRKQVFERDAAGVKKITSVMNIVNEEGSWGDWSSEISAQMLSKQNTVLIKTQLDMTLEKRQAEFKELSSLTNPTVKRKLLETFGDETESTAVHLQAAGFKRQGWHVILPISTMPPTQIYAPKYRDGERVALIRYPHGGTFEIPDLIVNNNHPEAKRVLGNNPRDAVGIHHSVAVRLSGADFDGDTVLVIPNPSRGTRRIKITPALEGLKDFDPKAVYGTPKGSPKTMTKEQKEYQMGVVSNLITDMTIRVASPPDLARAIRHSMVVIDAENHNLNWKQSALDNGISDLKEKYQGKKTAGASTLISRAGAKVSVPQRTPRPAKRGGPISKETGRREFEPTNRSFVNKEGERIFRMQSSTKLAETEDAHLLSSGTPQERLYADYANKMRVLANQSRREAVTTPRLNYSKSARKIYAKEVESLKDKLDLVERNRPLERQAQILANAQIRARKQENPGMDTATEKKVKNQALAEARIRTGATRLDIKITPQEWIAIQSGAISESFLNDILNKADLDLVRKYATPKTQRMMTSTMTTRAQQLFASGATRAQVADALGVSISTLDKALNES